MSNLRSDLMKLGGVVVVIVSLVGFSLKASIRKAAVPALIIVGDERYCSTKKPVGTWRALYFTDSATGLDMVINGEYSVVRGAEECAL